MNIQDLYIYPIKSCGGSRVESIQLDRFGPRDDRRWLLIDNEGMQITQREEARLALVRPSVQGDDLLIAFDGKQTLVTKPAHGQPRAVQVWSDTVQALDAGDDIAGWFSKALGRSVRLVWMPDDEKRQVREPFAKNGETVSFADAYPLLLISQASLDDLNTRLSESVPMNRFRPNIVVSGCTAFAEDTWRGLEVEGLSLQVAEACARCVMPSIDQSSGNKDSEILRVLASYRRGEDRQTYFGQNLLYQSFAELSVGQPITVH